VRSHGTIIGLCQAARQAARIVARASTEAKDRCLRGAATHLRTNAARILAANRADVQRARDAGLSPALLDRLTLSESRIEAMANGLDEVAQLPDPVGETIAQWRRPNGLQISQVRIPLGVVGIIYESRPNVTAEAAALCLKAGNAVILRGGSEALETNGAIAAMLAEAATAAGLPATTVQLVATADREAVQVLLKQNQYIDVIVPRGGQGLIQAITESSTIPVIQHYAGVCHTYVDEYADVATANWNQDLAVKNLRGPVGSKVTLKVQRPGVCNAMENMLVHAAVAPKFLPSMIRAFEQAGVEIRGCERTRQIVPGIHPASEDDWRTEYLDLILAVKVIDSLDEAIEFINTHGSGHSDAIVTEHMAHARRFLAEVDSAAVYVNASTRFTDGYEFGFGAEVGISTNRLHARGPMGLRELTTYKYVVYGSGQIRQ
jgi:glutamate-5-semialdehyde dehydrogenase